MTSYTLRNGIVVSFKYEHGEWVASYYKIKSFPVLSGLVFSFRRRQLPSLLREDIIFKLNPTIKEVTRRMRGHIHDDTD